MQWFGLLGAPFAWAVQLVVGFGVANASCSAGSSQWRIPVEAWEIALTAGAATVAVCGELAAATLYRELRNVEDDAPGPRGRLHFFSVASLAGNVLFLGLIALTGFGVLSHLGCRQG